MYVVIVGGGNVGYHLAGRLIADNHTVALVDKDAENCRKMAQNLEALIIQGDGCEPRFLEAAGVARANVIAACTGDDEDNLIICQLAKEIFKVKRTVARVNNPRNEHVFSELGVDVPVNSTLIIAKIIEEETSFQDFVNLMTFRKGKLALVRVDITEDAPVLNKPIKEIALPPSSVLVTIVRRDQIIVPSGDTVLKKGDDLVAMTLIENERALLETLIGKVT